MIRTIAIALFAVSTVSWSAGSPNAPAKTNLPALSRDWHGEDYQAIAAAISKGEIALPKYSSEQGEKFLARLTSLDNLSITKNKTMPFPARFQDVLAIMPAMNSIMLAYANAAGKGEKVNAELTAMLVFILHAAAAQVDLMNDFIPTLPRDETFATRMEGAKKVREGVTSIFLGASNSLAERSFFDSNDITLLLQAMSVTLPVFKNEFAADFRTELKGKFSAQRKGATSPEDIKSLDRMLADLER